MTGGESTRWGDEKVEKIIGGLLAAGVFLAAVVVFCGGIGYLLHYGNSPANYHEFLGEPDNFKSITAIVRYALGFHGRGIIQLGLLLLIATPIARVAVSIVGFALQRDRMYVMFTLAVLLILLYSLFGSAAMV